MELICAVPLVGDDSFMVARKTKILATINQHNSIRRVFVARDRFCSALVESSIRKSFWVFCGLRKYRIPKPPNNSEEYYKTENINGVKVSHLFAFVPRYRAENQTDKEQTVFAHTHLK